MSADREAPGTAGITFELIQQDFDRQVDAIYQLGRRAFASLTMDYLGWRFANQPDLTLFTARDAGQLVGFKVGYAMTEERYYSWLGAVDPAWQRRGIAARLMHEQHRWLSESKYRLVETHVRQSNTPMVALNLKQGLAIRGMFVKGETASYIMQRVIRR